MYDDTCMLPLYRYYHAIALFDNLWSHEWYAIMMESVGDAMMDAVKSKNM
jgi:hypothetical protein